MKNSNLIYHANSIEDMVNELIYEIEDLENTIEELYNKNIDLEEQLTIALNMDIDLDIRTEELKQELKEKDDKIKMLLSALKELGYE